MNTIFEDSVWTNYADSFLPITSTHMVEISQAIAPLAVGHVCDFGTGCCKIGPYLLSNPNVLGLTAIDYTLEMVENARWHLGQFSDYGKPTEVIHGRIEDLSHEPYELEIAPGLIETIYPPRFDFGLSINSFYTWNNPREVLKSIKSCLKDGAGFILVSPNPRLDMKALLMEVKMQLVGNPAFSSFAEQNMSIVGNEKALFIELDEIIDLCRSVGFRVKTANDSRFYNGGLSFLHLIK